MNSNQIDYTLQRDLPVTATWEEIGEYDSDKQRKDYSLEYR